VVNDMQLRTSVHYVEYLPPEDAVLDVIAVVRAEPGGDEGPGPGRGHAEVILLDCSGSMAAPQEKIYHARVAAAGAVDALPDGVPFAVVEGTDRATMVYPWEIKLAVADEQTRAAAKDRIRRLRPHGGTAIGSWLRLADRLLATHPGSIGHALVLTDGRNESEDRAVLEEAVAACTGRFTVDCWAIGARDGRHAWSGDELLMIAAALGANPVVPVEDPNVLVEEFTDRLRTAMSRRISDASLIVRTAAVARIQSIKQSYPTMTGLTARGVAGPDEATEYPIGAWGPLERRDFHIVLEVQQMPPGVKRRIAWIGIGAADPDPRMSPVQVIWTPDAALYSSTHYAVEHYTQHETLERRLAEAREAYESGRRADAQRLLGAAVRIASRLGDRNMLALLRRLCDWDDPEQGAVRLQSEIRDDLWPPFTVLSARTGAWRSGTGEVRPPVGAVPDGPCPKCGNTERTGNFCDACGHPGGGSA
jgi:hypothetical protein